MGQPLHSQVVFTLYVMQPALPNASREPPRPTWTQEDQDAFAMLVEFAARHGMEALPASMEYIMRQPNYNPELLRELIGQARQRYADGGHSRMNPLRWITRQLERQA